MKLILKLKEEAQLIKEETSYFLIYGRYKVKLIGLIPPCFFETKILTLDTDTVKLSSFYFLLHQLSRYLCFHVIIFSAKKEIATIEFLDTVYLHLFLKKYFSLIPEDKIVEEHFYFPEDVIFYVQDDLVVLKKMPKGPYLSIPVKSAHYKNLLNPLRWNASFKKVIDASGLFQKNKTRPWERHDYFFYSETTKISSTHQFGNLKRSGITDTFLPSWIRGKKIESSLSPFSLKDSGVRKSTRAKGAAIHKERLLQFLNYTFEFKDGHYRCPSAGSLYPYFVICFITGVSGLEDGIYSYFMNQGLFEVEPLVDSSDFSLVKSCFDQWANLGDSYCQLTLVHSLIRESSRYKKIALRNILLDAGVLIHQFYLSQEKFNLTGYALGVSHLDGAQVLGDEWVSTIDYVLTGQIE